jgi:hypothetical protein
VALWIEDQTDNRNRLGADMGRLLTQAGSSPGEPAASSF